MLYSNNKFCTNNWMVKVGVCLLSLIDQENLAAPIISLKKGCWFKLSKKLLRKIFPVWFFSSARKAFNKDHYYVFQIQTDIIIVDLHTSLKIERKLKRISLSTRTIMYKIQVLKKKMRHEQLKWNLSLDFMDLGSLWCFSAKTPDG